MALLFHDHGTRRGEGSALRPGRSLPPGKTRYPLYRRLGGLQGRSGQVRKISTPSGIRLPDRPARSQSLYRLSYRAHNFYKLNLNFQMVHKFLHIFSTWKLLWWRRNYWSFRKLHKSNVDFLLSFGQFACLKPFFLLRIFCTLLNCGRLSYQN
jgi:hypothetical protein